MTRKSSPLAAAASLAAVLVLATAASPIDAFTVPTGTLAARSSSSSSSSPHTRFAPLLYAEETKEQADAVFMPLPSSEDDEEDDDDDVSIDLDTVEMLGKGAAKAKRGKRKGGPTAPKVTTKASVTLTPEEVFYEGPPAITETIVPTISILTVVGIVPAIASWSRQAWVRYKVTSRRIRVTSGIGGKDMAEIVYPDIVELRTAKRLFGDGDVVAFLRDGAKFEMRNVPNFDETIEYILKQVDPDVAAQYRSKGDVTRQ